MSLLKSLRQLILEGFTIPATVNFVGKGADLRNLGYKLSGATMVGVRYFSKSWLWEKIRVQGGAYGGFCTFDRDCGAFTFLSYRDPNLLATLDIYDRTAEFLKSASMSDTEVTQSIIGTIGDLDAYQLPDAKGYASVQRHLVGDTDEIRQRMRDEILAAGIGDFRALADVLAQVAERGRVVVLGSEEAIEAANAERPGFLSVSRVM